MTIRRRVAMLAALLVFMGAAALCDPPVRKPSCALGFHGECLVP